jgi:hypothetical protein
MTITRAAKAPTGVRGSHKFFWDFFYVGSRHLVPRVDPSIRFALLPITTTTWLTDERNEVNYRPDKALAAAVAFAGSFDPARVMSSLPGPMATQLRVTEALAILAAQFGARFGVGTSVTGPRDPPCDSAPQFISDPPAAPRLSRPRRTLRALAERATGSGSCAGLGRAVFSRVNAGGSPRANSARSQAGLRPSQTRGFQ